MTKTVDIPVEAERRINADQVVWLTTVTDSGAPAPNPVWFVRDGDDFVVFSEPTSHKVHNIARRPVVTLHFNSDPGGGDVVVITGEARGIPDHSMLRFPAYLDKYGGEITEALGTTADALARTYNTCIRIHPTRIRLTS